MFCCSGGKEQLGKYACRTCWDESIRWLMHDIHLVGHSHGYLCKIIMSIVLKNGHYTFSFLLLFFLSAGAGRMQ